MEGACHLSRTPLGGAAEVSHSPELNHGENEGISLLNYFPEVVYEVVMDQVVSHLNLEEMKDLSLTSKDGLRIVRNHKTFFDVARLHLNQEVLESRLHPATFLELPWKHIAVNLSNQVSLEREDIGRILETADSVYLSKPAVDGRYTFRHEVDGAASIYLGEILTKTQHLKTLLIETNLLYYIEPNVWSAAEVSRVIRRLDSFQFCKIRETFIVHSEEAGCSNHGFQIRGEERFQQHFKQLLPILTNLKSLHFPHCRSKHPRFIPDNRCTLEDLELLIANFEGDLEALKCPNLKTLNVSCDTRSNGELLAKFIRLQPPLQELAVVLEGGLSLNSIVSSVFREDALVSKLRKLHLQADIRCRETKPLDWKFLEGMTCLKDVAIGFVPSPWPVTTFTFAEDIIGLLPNQIEKLSMEGYREGFWRRGSSDRNLNGICRFRNLRELHLLYNFGIMTDDQLQGIISTFPKLESLSFSGGFDAPSLTNYGLTGIDEMTKERTGVSLDQLACLQHLKILPCRKVSPVDGLLPVMTFKLLRSFEFDVTQEVGDLRDFIFRIAKQNPSLERMTLYLRIYLEEYEQIKWLNDLKEKVREINPRLRSVVLKNRVVLPTPTVAIPWFDSSVDLNEDDAVFWL